MEKQLFTWGEWDDIDTLVFQFYRVTLVRDIGPLKAGRSFDWASIDYDNGKLEFGTSENGGDSSKADFTFDLTWNITPTT